jgi:hypothetical protein
VLALADPRHVTLTANTVMTITLDVDADKVNICNVSGDAEIYVTVDGTIPSVGGDGAWVLPAAIGDLELEVSGSGNTIVKLISSGTPRVSVGVVA